MIGSHGNFQGTGNFQGPELLAAPGIFQGAWKFSGPGNFQAPWKIPGSWIFPGPLENSRGVLISGQTRCAGVSGNSRSRPFPRMKASDSLSRIMGMDFFIPFPFPNFGNAFFSFPSRSRIVGMHFFKSLPIPEFAISQTGIKTGIGLL